MFEYFQIGQVSRRRKHNRFLVRGGNLHQQALRLWRNIATVTRNNTGIVKPIIHLASTSRIDKEKRREAFGELHRGWACCSKGGGGEKAVVEYLGKRFPLTSLR